MSLTYSILALGAHPDDLEFGCGAVLLKERTRGTRLTLAISSRGEAGTAGTPEEREDEARAASQMLGVPDGPVFLDFGGDGQQRETPENALQLARLIRRIQPDLVLAPLPCENQHPDHTVVGRLARTACRQARYGGLLRDLPRHSVQGLWFYSITHESPLDGAVLVDISAQVEDWKRLMHCHQTQVQSRAYVDLQLSRARQWGLRAGCEHALALWPNDPPRLDYLTDLPYSARSF
ncbi:MAG: PIG-L family deacetylase [Verrucomicrobiota bacterium JB022]|nr:PIG-L family deacetylase [Verrucomicrobiota bacterium JB022]